MSSWFEELFGFAEHDADSVHRNLSLDGEWLTTADGRRFRCGELTIPSLAELRAQLAATAVDTAPLTLREVVGDAGSLHVDPSNAGAVFQVASQFNLLEMVDPSVTPEQGITGYAFDLTQGPACAIACAPGTVYRNYFVPTGGGVGQTSERQVDCLAGVGAQLGNGEGDTRLWDMRNGYALPTADGLADIDRRLASLSPAEYDALAGALRVGVHRDTEVTLRGAGHTVTQVYGSALPVSYTEHAAGDWRRFGALVLGAAYEATLCAAAIERARTGCRSVFLTLLGGGAFGNPDEWIADAIVSAAMRLRQSGLDVAIVSYGSAKPIVADIIERYADAVS